MTFHSIRRVSGARAAGYNTNNPTSEKREIKRVGIIIDSAERRCAAVVIYKHFSYIF
jgi:hypothetical protein